MSDISFKTIRTSATIIRPANTTTYASGDAVTDNTPAILTFANAVREAGRTGTIDSAILVCDANNTIRPDLELWLFDTAPAATTDNAAWAPTDAELLRLIGIVTFPMGSFKSANAGAAAAGNIAQTLAAVGMVYKAIDTNIYGQLVIRNAYVPVSGETFTVNLLATLD